MEERKGVEPEVKTETQEATAKPKFKSSFKAWIRMVAFIVVAVFLPEQAAQAAQYDLRVFWPKAAAAMGLGA